MRRCLAFQQKNEVASHPNKPRLPMGERGAASSQQRKKRRRLITASPFSRRTRQCHVPAKDASSSSG
ncbi:hypothetical protein GW17_00040169 [Ensete ventricosum]|nr:hypothetical protein GW17_00040169 [Ensete ventricosum]